jgi:hypothetical protein
MSSKRVVTIVTILLRGHSLASNPLTPALSPGGERAGDYRRTTNAALLRWHSLASDPLTPALSPGGEGARHYRCTTNVALLRWHSLASDPSPQPSPRGEREPDIIDAQPMWLSCDGIRLRATPHPNPLPGGRGSRRLSTHNQCGSLAMAMRENSDSGGCNGRKRCAWRSIP